MPTKKYKVQTTSSRQLHLSKLDNGNYKVELYWGRGDKVLATLVLEPKEFKRLRDTAVGLMNK